MQPSPHPSHRLMKRFVTGGAANLLWVWKTWRSAVGKSFLLQKSRTSVGHLLTVFLKVVSES
jgi:hypothetical protein